MTFILSNQESQNDSPVFPISTPAPNLFQRSFAAYGKATIGGDGGGGGGGGGDNDVNGKIDNLNMFWEPSF